MFSLPLGYFIQTFNLLNVYDKILKASIKDLAWSAKTISHKKGIWFKSVPCVCSP